MIKRGIGCRTIFPRCQRFDQAVKGNAAALKFWDAAVDETNKQFGGPEAPRGRSVAYTEEWNARILDKVKRQQEWLDNPPRFKNHS